MSIETLVPGVLWRREKDTTVSLPFLQVGFSLSEFVLAGVNLPLTTEEEPSKPLPLAFRDMTRRVTCILIIAAVLGSVVWYLHASRELETVALQKEDWNLAPVVDSDSVEEVGYIYEVKVQNRLWERERSIYWFVRVPATNKRYSCSWESGYPGFAREDAVKIIHKKPEIDDGDYSGFIVGLHGSKSGKSAAVWALDIEDIELDLDE
jgi:hypothetical protein